MFFISILLKGCSTGPPNLQPLIGETPSNHLTLNYKFSAVQKDGFYTEEETESFSLTPNNSNYIKELTSIQFDKQWGPLYVMPLLANSGWGFSGWGFSGGFVLGNWNATGLYLTKDYFSDKYNYGVASVQKLYNGFSLGFSVGEHDLYKINGYGMDNEAPKRSIVSEVDFNYKWNMIGVSIPIMYVKKFKKFGIGIEFSTYPKTTEIKLK